MDTLIFALNAVLPIILLIGLGYILKLSGFINDNFLEVANKLVFRIALPALLFYNIYSVNSLKDINWSVILYAAIGIFILLIIGFVFSRLFIKDPRQKGVIIQTTLRANFAIIGIPLAESIGGSQAVANVALIALVGIPLMSGLSVIVLSLAVHDKSLGNPFKIAFLKVIKNPLIIGVATGLLVLWLRSFIPLDPVDNSLAFSLAEDLKFIYVPLKWLGQITSPLALIVLGATFKFSLIGSLKKQIILGTALRSVVAPVITLGLAIILASRTSFFKFDEFVYPALISLFGSPTAITNAVMVREMHSDENLSVQLVVWTTLASIITIFVIVVIFRNLGLI
jgi:predicted permease